MIAGPSKGPCRNRLKPNFRIRHRWYFLGNDSPDRAGGLLRINYPQTLSPISAERILLTGSTISVTRCIFPLIFLMIMALDQFSLSVVGKSSRKCPPRDSVRKSAALPTISLFTIMFLSSNACVRSVALSIDRLGKSSFRIRSTSFNSCLIPA